MKQEIFERIIDSYNTPIYIYDGDIIERQYKLLKYLLPDDFQVYYSMKTNPLTGICQLLKNLGANIEVASGGELYNALQASYEPKQIIFTSPGKTYEELEYSISNNIYSINVESIEEINIINDIAHKMDKIVNISLRINPNFNVTKAKLKMAGVSSQFGIDEVNLSEAMYVLQECKHTRLIGMHIYCGTQILDYNNISSNIKKIFEFTQQFVDTYNWSLEFLDLGGGFGVPYFDRDKNADLEAFKDDVNTIWKKYSRVLSDTAIAVESGRFIMAESGVFATKVIYKKSCKGKTYLVCDGGSNNHSTAAFLGRHIRDNFPIKVHNTNSEKELVTVVGPLCTPTDVIGQNVNIAKCEVGDIITIEKSGAYGLTNSPTLFLSHVTPPEVISYKNKVTVLRERGNYKDFLCKQNRLDFI